MSDDSDALVMQRVRVFKAGNSLAIRVPSVIVDRLALGEGTIVEMAAERGMISMRKAPSCALSNLIERITPQNVHESIFDEPTT